MSLVPQPFTFGVCNTAGPIEIESSGGTAAGVPTAYATLALAFSAINGASLHLGTITIDVCGNTTETGTGASLNQVAGVTSITMSPAGGAARTISGAITAGNPLINLNGADNVTIDGLNSGGNSLTLSNTSTGSTAGTSTLRFIADASTNLISNTTIWGSSTSTLATVAGTIVFSTGTTTGNDNNTIQQCDIGPAGANLPSKAIMASGTSSAIENDNNQIIFNNIYDFFLAGSSTSGINILTGNEAWPIQSNRFYQTATRTFTTATSRYAAITLNNSTGGFDVSSNTIGFADSAGTGATTIGGLDNEFRGIDAPSVRTSAPATNIANNTISGINQTTSRASTTTASSAFIAVAMGTTDGLVNATGNTVGSLDGSSTIVVNSSSTTASTAPMIGFYNFSFFTTTVSDNNIGSITIQGTGTTVGFRGILVNTTTGAGATINNNTIANITDTQVGSYSMYGIQSALPNLTATGNTIRNMTGASNGASLIVSAGILASGATGANTISQNTIHSLSNASGAAANSIYGMSLSLPSAANVVERNFIHSLSLTSTVASTQVWGISSGATGTTTYRNNMIRLGYNSAGASVTLPTSMIGIRDAAGSTNQYFHNTIYIGGTGVLNTPTASNSYCFFSDVTAVTRAHQNNIYWNARGNALGGGTAHIVTREGGTAANPAGLTSNFNILYFTGTDGATGVFNAVVVPTLAAWRTATGQDNNSSHGDPQLIAPTGTASTVDLHIHPTNPTPIEAAGTLVASVTNDFDGQTRSTLTPVDIGADAGNFVPQDVSAPIISYTPFGNTTSTVDRTLSVTITDVTGVANGATLPRLYFKKSTDAGYVSTQCIVTGGTAQNGTYDCTTNYTLVGGGAVTAGNTVQYFVVAQDTLGNLAANPSAGFTGTSVNAVTTPPTTPNSYLILGNIGGSVLVGTGETITSLTNAGGLFEKINQSVVTANVVVNLTSDLTAETGAVALNQTTESGAGNYTINIQASGGPRLISGSNTTALINLNGADRVTFSGLAFGPLGITIRNTSVTTGAAVQWANDASNNGLLSVRVEGGNTNSSSALVLFGNGTTIGNDNNAITSCELRDRTDVVGLPANAIASFNSSTTARNSNNSIVDTKIMNFVNNGFATSSTATSENWTVTGNEVIQTAARAGSTFGFNLGGIVGTNVFSGNSIHGFTTTGSNQVLAFLVGNSLGLTIANNRVYDFQTTAGATGVIGGIEYDGASGGTPSLTVVNNFVALTPTLATAQQIIGIHDFAFGGNTFSAYHNTVYIGGTATGASPSWAIKRGNSAPTTFTAKNNLAYNARTGGTSSHFALGDESANTGTFVCDNNFYVGLGSTPANFFDYGTTSTGTPVSFVTWQGGPPTRDANSTALLSTGTTPGTYFINAATADLHLIATAGPTIIGAGATVGSVTNDIDQDPRPGTAPDIGADELVQASGGSFPSGTFYNAVGGTGDLLAGNVTITNRLTLTGKLDAGANTLTINCAASIVGANASNYLLGNLKQMVCVPGAFNFPVGTTNGYSPVDATVTANGGGGSDSLAVKAVQNYYGGNAETPALNPNSLQRYWDLNKTGSLTANLKWTFLPGDVIGAGLPYKIIRISGTTAASFANAGDCGTNPLASPCVDVANNFMYMANVSTFSKWTGGPALAPTATGAGISGRVTTADGRGITNARVFLSGGGLTQPIMVQTGQLGIYQFDGLVIGRSYVVSVQSQRFTFAESTRFYELNANVTNADFVAEPQQ